MKRLRVIVKQELYEYRNHNGESCIGLRFIEVYLSRSKQDCIAWILNQENPNEYRLFVEERIKQNE